MRSSPSSRDCSHAFVETFPPTQSEVSWKQPYFEARMPGTNGEYLEGEASPKFLPCLRSLLQPHFGAAPEVCKKATWFFCLFICS